MRIVLEELEQNFLRAVFEAAAKNPPPGATTLQIARGCNNLLDRIANAKEEVEE